MNNDNDAKKLETPNTKRPLKVHRTAVKVEPQEGICVRTGVKAGHDVVIGNSEEDLSR